MLIEFEREINLLHSTDFQEVFSDKFVIQLNFFFLTGAMRFCLDIFSISITHQIGGRASMCQPTFSMYLMSST